MSSSEVIDEALQLPPQERFLIVDTLLKSLDKPDEAVETVWEKEAQKRLQHYKEGKTRTISFEEIFNED